MSRGRKPTAPHLKVLAGTMERAHHFEDQDMSAIDCDYLDDYDRRRQHQGIPPDLAALIARKAAAMAAEFETRAQEELKNAARRHLQAGQKPDDIAWQMGL